MVDVNTPRQIVIFIFKLGTGPYNLTARQFTYNLARGRFEMKFKRTRIHFIDNVFATVTVVVFLGKTVF